MVYSPTGSGNIHYDQFLTNVSLEYTQNTAWVCPQLFPTVQVRKQSDKYYVFGRETWVPETSDYRAPGTEANEIPGRTVSTDTYYAQEHALQVPVVDEERENTDSPFNPDRDGTELVTNKVLLGRELAMYNFVIDATKYAAGNTVTISGTNQWNDYTNSDPIPVFRTAFRRFQATIGLQPNVAVIPWLVLSVLEDHPKLITRIQYTDRAILTPEIVGALLGLPGKVIVPGMLAGAQVQTGQTYSGNGFNVTVSYLWGKHVLLAYVPPRPGLRTPAFAYEFNWSYNGSAQAVDRWREEKRKADLLRMSRRYDLKMVGVEITTGSADLGKSITGYLMLNVIA